MMSTIHATESFEVLEWLQPDNSSFQLRHGYSQGGNLDYTIRNVSYPSWDYTYYENEVNETFDGSMYPLWRDVSDWKLRKNVSINYGTYITRIFTVETKEEVQVGDVSVYCWVVECKYVDSNNWDYTARHHYDVQFGVLIKKYLHRWPGTDDYMNIASFTDTLVSTNIIDELESSAPILFGLDLRGLLIVGILVETAVIVALFVKRKVGK